MEKTNDVQYIINTFGGWAEIVKNFLYRNYIHFTVKYEQPKKWFSGGEKAIFEFRNLTERESGLVDGFFEGLKDTVKNLKG